VELRVDTLLVVVGITLSIVGLLGVSYAVFRTNVVSKTIELYKNENEILGKALARQQTEAEKLATRLQALETANEVLRTTVSGERAIAELREQAKGWFAHAQDQHKVQMDLLHDIHDDLLGKGGKRHGGT